MNDKDLLESLISEIQNMSDHDFDVELKNHMSLFKEYSLHKINSIDVDNIYNSDIIIRDIKIHIELIIKLYEYRRDILTLLGKILFPKNNN